MRTSTVLVTLALFAQAGPGTSPPRYQRDIVIAAPGPQRLAVDAALLAGSTPFTVARRGTSDSPPIAQGGLSDLRLFDRDGREVPYLLMYPPVAEARWADARIEEIAATKKSSGFEADLRSPRDVDALALRGLSGPFLKRFVLEASGDRAHWTVVVPEATMFDLPDQQLRETTIRFDAGTYRYLRLTWDDTNSARVPLPGGAAARLAARVPPHPPVLLELSIEGRPSEPGVSRYHLKLPAPRLPMIALQIRAGTGYVFRNASVTEPRLANGQAEPATIGRALLVRQARGGDDPLRILVQQPAQSELDLVVQDGDNPPLPITGAAAELAELPWIYFEASGPVAARYGDAALTAPTYDIEAARRTLKIDEVPEAHWATAAPRRLEEPGAPSSAVFSAGAALDPAPFRYARDIPAGPASLIALPLDAAVLAHSAGPARRFSDVRVIDAAGRQVPSLIERRPDPLPLALPLAPARPQAPQLQPTAGSNRSVYRIALPYPQLPDATIVVTTASRVFHRSAQIGYERPADRTHRDAWFDVLASRVWEHADAASPAPALAAPLRSADTTDVLLVIDEGDNSALPIGGVQLLLPFYRLRFFRPPSTPLRLVYGRSDLDPPQYDLALLAPRVLGAAAIEIAPGAEQGTPAAAGDRLISPLAFWIVLGAAVVVLLGLIVTLLRAQTR